MLEALLEERGELVGCPLAHVMCLDLRRDSLWEALTTPAKARPLLLRHRAAVTGIRDPEYGIASLLDYGGPLPEGLESTLAELDATQIRRAALACADLLATYGQRPFADFVMGGRRRWRGPRWIHPSGVA